jgi:putative component of membrane protein insertase Oxa1/YidC/SpoIIIJ protein YidD
MLKGIVLTVHRLFRCHPWGGHGYDPPRWFGDRENALEASPSTSPRDQAQSDS